MKKHADTHIYTPNTLYLQTRHSNPHNPTQTPPSQNTDKKLKNPHIQNSTKPSISNRELKLRVSWIADKIAERVPGISNRELKL